MKVKRQEQTGEKFTVGAASAQPQTLGTGASVRPGQLLRIARNTFYNITRVTPCGRDTNAQTHELLPQGHPLLFRSLCG